MGAAAVFYPLWPTITLGVCVKAQLHRLFACLWQPDRMHAGHGSQLIGNSKQGIELVSACQVQIGLDLTWEQVMDSCLNLDQRGPGPEQTASGLTNLSHSCRAVCRQPCCSAALGSRYVLIWASHFV
jgi:hypothetical protein